MGQEVKNVNQISWRFLKSMVSFTKGKINRDNFEYVNGVFLYMVFVSFIPFRAYRGYSMFGFASKFLFRFCKPHNGSCSCWSCSLKKIKDV